MGTVKIAYYVVRNGRGFWQPNSRMVAMGAKCVSCGEDGPAAWARAQAALNAWRARQAAPEHLRSAPAPGTIAAGFEEYRRTEEWKAKKPRTREE